MQGLPNNLLTSAVAPATTNKVESNSPVMVNGKVVKHANSKIPGNSENSGETAETKGAFASLFSSMIGGNAEGETPAVKSEAGVIKGDTAMAGVAVNPESKSKNPDAKLDVLMSEKNQDINKKSVVVTPTPEQALSPEVLKNIDNLLDKSQPVVGEKVAATSSNLDQLLQSLKAQKDVKFDDKNETLPEEANGAKETKKAGTPLEFLLKQSKESNVGNVKNQSPEVTEKLLETNPEGVSKLGLSSEDFISQLTAKDTKDAKVMTKHSDVMNLDNSTNFDPKEFAQSRMNQSMKSYGQKQDLLNGNIIRSSKDLASRDSKSKVNADELKTPDMKIGAELAGMKESMIPLMHKQEQNQLGQQTMAQGSEKVLDLSKMNTSNTTEIIKRISDYVAQERVANKDSLDLTVKHDTLGQFKIQVNRPVGANQQMDMQITTSTSEGHDFFMKNEIGLMKNLSQAGIQLSDLRIVSESGNSSFAGMDSRQNNSQNSSQFANKEFMSFEAAGDSSNGSDRRRELWQEARNNQQRYGA